MPKPLRVRWAPRTAEDALSFDSLAWKKRVALLERVRRDEPGAAEELWDRYRCRVIRPDEGQ